LLGAAHGALWQAASALLCPLPRWLQRSLWLLVMLALGAGLARELGAFSRLGSRHHDQALAAVAAITVGAAVAGFGLSALQPRVTSSGPATLPLRPRLRVAAALALAVGAALLFYVDRRYYVGLYAAAHHALRLACLACATFALGLAAVALRAPPLRARWVGAGALVLVVALAVVEFARPQALPQWTLVPWPADVVRIAQRVADADRDGYAQLFGGGDCNDLDAAVHPGAHEIPGNGIDDNCVLGDRQLTPPPIEVIESARAPVDTDVVLITLDTTRPDHLGLYNPAGYGPKGRATSPNLDRWSQGAFVFDNAITTGAWTVLALSSVLRGVNPRRIRWTPHFETSLFRLIPQKDAGKLLAKETLLHMFLMPTHDTHVTLPTLLQRRGMKTIAIVDDGYSMMLQGSGGFDKGFSEYIQMRTSSTTPPDAATVNRAVSVIRRLGPRERYFLWVHMFGPHAPNEVRPGVPSYGPSIIDGYDHEVRYMDEQLGRLFAALALRKPEPVVIVAGDHGEFFSPTNRWHGYSLEEDQMRIPLMVKLPGKTGRRIGATVSLADVFPTILALTDTPGPERSIDGISLEPLLGGAPPSPRIVLTDCWRYDARGHLAMDAVGATDGHRFVYYDRLNGTAAATTTRVPSVRWLEPTELMKDPLARFALGYVEEVAPLPR
jgi:arylsulfatase A-like enzyme